MHVRERFEGGELFVRVRKGCQSKDGVFIHHKQPSKVCITELGCGWPQIMLIIIFILPNYLHF